jgi:hypothetical protein
MQPCRVSCAPSPPRDLSIIQPVGAGISISKNFNDMGLGLFEASAEPLGQGGSTISQNPHYVQQLEELKIIDNIMCFT